MTLPLLPRRRRGSDDDKDEPLNKEPARGPLHLCDVPPVREPPTLWAPHLRRCAGQASNLVSLARARAGLSHRTGGARTGGRSRRCMSSVWRNEFISCKVSHDEYDGSDEFSWVLLEAEPMEA